MNKPGRNDPCPCGSEKKYKQCCLVKATEKQAVASQSAEQAIQLAIQHHQAGRLLEAEAIYRQVLERFPDYPDALHLLGLVAHQRGENELAADLIGQAIRVNPSMPVFYDSFGSACFAMGKADVAVESYRKAIELKPDFANAHYNLANVLNDQGRHDEAVASFRKALEIRPDYAEAYCNLGHLLQTQGNFDDAVICYQKALAFKPDFAEAHNNLGSVLQAQDKLEEAISCYQKALELKPDYAEAHNNLGLVFNIQGNLEEAIACYHKALGIKPDYADAYNNLGNVLVKIRGKLGEAIASFQKALEIEPDFVEARSNLIFILDMSPGVDRAILQQERRKWDEIHAAPLMQPWLHRNTPDPERRLRIGYVSADFKLHSAALVFGAMLVRFDPSRFDVYAYSNTTNEDDYTQLFQQRVTCWRKIVGMSDEAVADLIRQDEIDILVDLSGHSAGNRLLVFARKPAPVQVTAWGYATSTGMRAMDVFFADPVVVPPEEKAFITEEVRYLPNVVGFFCPEIFPPVNALPALSSGEITFGSFNRLVKISEEAFHVWVQVLQAVPHGRLILKIAELDDQGTRDMVAGYFTSEGIAPERITLLGRTTRQEHVAAFNRIDIALDPFPHGGGVTTLEGLMMGIPHVTLRRPSIVGRLSASILTTLGLADWVAETPEQYVQIAVQKAQDLQALAELRGRLRSIFTSSVIGDPNLYVAAVEKEYRQLWREWCERRDHEMVQNVTEQHTF